jgi:hypothetical protein
MFKHILSELKVHAPFTLLGTTTGILIMVFFKNLPARISYNIFYVLHPIHVILSALVTASIYELHECGQISRKCIKGKCNFWTLLAIGYFGSVGIATISDSFIPFVGEYLLNMPNRGLHLGFIEKWWLVNPLAILGVVIAYCQPMTKFPHAGHVLLSTWASLFHIILAAQGVLSVSAYAVVFLFLFLAVWVPCCISDIVFPLLFVKK